MDRYLLGQLVPPEERTITSHTGVLDWTKPQFYMSRVKKDNWDHLMFSDGGRQLLTPEKRLRLYVIKFGCKKDGVRHTTHTREFGGDYQLLDSFLTEFPVEVEGLMRGWARARGLLMEGRHNKRDGKDTELLGLDEEGMYHEAGDAALGFVEQVNAEKRAALGMATEPLEVQLERVRQAEETKRHLQTEETQRHREDEETKRHKEDEETKRHREDEETERLQILADLRKAEMQTVTPPDITPVVPETDTASQSTGPKRTHEQAQEAPMAGEMVSFKIPAHRVKCQPVYQHTMTGEFVEYHNSGAEAVKNSKKEGNVNFGIIIDVSSISECAANKRSSHQGFMWRMVPQSEWKLETISVPRSTHGRIMQMDERGNLVNRYLTMDDAAQAVRVCIQTLKAAIKRKEVLQLHRWKTDSSVPIARRVARAAKVDDSSNNSP